MPTHPDTDPGIFGADGAPNLDCLSIDPTDMDTAARVLRQLSQYATLKGRAMRSRMTGDVNEALRLEGFCDALYRQLPKWARW